ncbi:MAG: ABC transporter permease subunit [bacterium]
MPKGDVERKAAYRMDRLAKGIVVFGGISIILSVIAIVSFISAGALPLLKKATYEDVLKIKVDSENPGARTMAVGLDEFGEVGYRATDSGIVDFFSLKDGESVDRVALEKLGGRRVSSAFRSPHGDLLILGTTDGKALNVDVRFRSVFEAGGRRIEFAVREGELIEVDEANRPIIRLVGGRKEDGVSLIASVSEGGSLILTMFDPEEGSVERYDLTQMVEGDATALALTADCRDLLVGSDGGVLYYFDLTDAKEPHLKQKIAASRDEITALGFLIGQWAVAVGDRGGNVSVWFKVPGEGDGDTLYRKIRAFEPHGAPIVRIAASPRDRSFLTADSRGEIRLHHSTSHRTLFNYRGHRGAIGALAFAPRGDGCISVDEGEGLKYWRIDNPHPEVTLKTLFGKVWYEGYRGPAFVWQSTGMTDEFEPKLSLVPVIFGTIKGTLYAMLFSAPVGVVSAIYLSQLAPVRLRNFIKPMIEVMAALPSVVVGFLAGLWLAPLVERNFVALFLAFVLFPAFVLVGARLWHLIPPSHRGRVGRGAELIIASALLAVSVIVALTLAPAIEDRLFGGDFKQWLFDVLGVRYDQRNAIVIGFALGFAVIPIIFTVSEDAMSAVPPHLVSASLALGASPWQTAVNLVVPAAAPGIFAAVMLGFGRAVGETMIVLMATGNTPILDWSPFNGMRTMSATIAVEIPEAPQGGTLYRVLFLIALLLFAFTFAINMAAEFVRGYLRRRYGRF